MQFRGCFCVEYHAQKPHEPKPVAQRSGAQERLTNGESG